MFGRRFKWISWLLLVVFVAGMGSCLFVCADDDHCADADAAQHCALQCACQALAVMPATAGSLPPVTRSYLVLGDAPVKLPLFAASIFQPPKA